jgi:hypothetical protein
MRTLVLEQQMQSPAVGRISVFEVGATDVTTIPVDTKSGGVVIGQRSIVQFRGSSFLMSSHIYLVKILIT